MSFDWETAAAVVAQLFIVALLIERAMAGIQSWRWWKDKIEGRGLVYPIAFFICLGVALQYKYDAFAVILVSATNHAMGYVLTAASVAGGAQPFIVMFRRMLEAKTESSTLTRTASSSSSSVTKSTAESGAPGGVT